MKKVIIKIDGIGLNATHYVPMGEEKAVEELMKDGGIVKKIGKDKVEAWAPKAFEILEREYNKAKAAAQEKVVADAKKKMKANEFSTAG